MSERLYTPIIRDAWKITTKHSWLWFLGLFAALLGNGGAFNVVTNNLYKLNEYGGTFTTVRSFLTGGLTADLVDNILNAAQSFNFWLFLVTLVFIALFALLVWLANSCLAALVYGASRFHTTRPSNLQKSWQYGQKRFWYVFGVQLFGKVLMYAIGVPVSILLFIFYLLGPASVVEGLWLFVLFLIFVPMAWVLTVLVKYATIEVVLKKKHVWEGFVGAWHLFVKNWLVSLEMVALLLFLNILMMLGFVLVWVVLTIPFGLALASFIQLGLVVAYQVTLVLYGLSAIALVMFFGAWFASFQTSVWVYLYERLSSGEAFAKLNRLFHG